MSVRTTSTTFENKEPLPHPDEPETFIIKASNPVVANKNVFIVDDGDNSVSLNPGCLSGLVQARKRVGKPLKWECDQLLVSENFEDPGDISGIIDRGILADSCYGLTKDTVSYICPMIGESTLTKKSLVFSTASRIVQYLIQSLRTIDQVPPTLLVSFAAFRKDTGQKAAMYDLHTSFEHDKPIARLVDVQPAKSFFKSDLTYWKLNQPGKADSVMVALFDKIVERTFALLKSKAGKDLYGLMITIHVDHRTEIQASYSHEYINVQDGEEDHSLIVAEKSITSGPLDGVEEFGSIVFLDTPSPAPPAEPRVQATSIQKLATAWAAGAVLPLQMKLKCDQDMISQSLYSLMITSPKFLSIICLTGQGLPAIMEDLNALDYLDYIYKQNKNFSVNKVKTLNAMRSKMYSRPEISRRGSTASISVNPRLGIEDWRNRTVPDPEQGPEQDVVNDNVSPAGPSHGPPPPYSLIDPTPTGDVESRGGSRIPRFARSVMRGNHFRG